MHLIPFGHIPLQCVGVRLQRRGRASRNQCSGDVNVHIFYKPFAHVVWVPAKQASGENRTATGRCSSGRDRAARRQGGEESEQDDFTGMRETAVRRWNFFFFFPQKLQLLRLLLLRPFN